MKKIFRDDFVDEYWEKRWEDAGVDESKFTNMDIYPIKYSEIVTDSAMDILEAGCGNGRLLFHYKNNGKNIKGIDYSQNAIKNILNKDPDMDVVKGSVTELPYENESFDSVMAFGLYHGLESEEIIDKAFEETSRVLRKDGKIVFSVRLNSLENDILEHKVKSKKRGRVFNKFHKWQFDEDDIKYYMNKHNLEINNTYYVRNVSVLFKYEFFKAKDMKKNNFSESKARSEGFKLNLLGRIIDKILHEKFPKHFSNLIVVIATKK